MKSNQQNNIIKILFFFLKILFPGGRAHVLFSVCLSVYLPAYLEMVWTWSQRWGHLGLSWLAAAVSHLPGYTCEGDVRVSQLSLTPLGQNCSLESVSKGCSLWTGTDGKEAGMNSTVQTQPGPTSESLVLSSSQTSRTHPLCRAGSRCHCPLGQPSLCAARPGSLTLVVQLVPQGHCLQGERAVSVLLHHISKLFLECWQNQRCWVPLSASAT